MKIKIRHRSNKNSTRVVADIYYGLGKREHVKIGNIYPNEADPAVKEHNDSVRLKAISFVQEFAKTNNPYAFHTKSKYNLNSNFINYFKQYADERRDEGLQQYISSYNHLVAFIKNRPLYFHEITFEFVKAFHDYLFEKAISRKNKKLSNNTAVAYFEKFSIVLNNAVEDKIISSNPINSMKRRGKYIQPLRSHLTEPEIDIVEKLPLEENTVLKRAFLFSCQTGIRFGDVLKLKIKDIYSVDTGKFACSIVMNKQKKPLAIPLNKRAMDIILCELCRKKDEKVFLGLKYAQSNVILKKWVADAGIYKEITFHNSRHSFACNLINKGRDLLEVRDLLGHKSVKTTEIYARTTSENLRSAVESLDKCVDI